MNSSFKYILAFSVGAAVGVAASRKYFKTKYEQIAQEEIDKVTEYYSEYYGTCKKADEPQEVTETDKEKYEALANGYSSEPTSVKNEDDSEPHVITPEELGDIDEYDTTTLYYYADGVLVTLDDEVVEDVAGTVGEDFASHFGEYEDESVCVRNDAYKCDYEILRDTRRYSEIKKPAKSREAEE